MIDFNSTKWADPNYRAQVIASIKSNYNVARKVESYHCWNIFNDKIDSYVKEYLLSQLAPKTVARMPIISTINIAKKIVKSEAMIYNDCPERTFNGDYKEIFEKIYASNAFDTTMRRSNEYYKLLRQTLLQVYLDDGKIKVRVINNHNYDVISNENNPERADAYILSPFDKMLGQMSVSQSLVAIQEPEYKMTERYVVWDNDVNFVMNGNGEIISSETSNPIGMMPFVDVSSEKDMNYFVNGSDTLCNFTIQYNGALSDLANIVRLQGYAQAIIKGPAESMPDEVYVGGTSIIRLVTNPDNQAQVDFDFKTPNPNIDGSIRALEQLLANFLSTRGIDTNAISGTLGKTNTYSSGTERLLAMLDKWNISRSDLDLFEDIEYKLFNIIRRFAITFSGSEFLSPEYFINEAAMNDTFSIKYEKPEGTMSEKEELDLLVAKEDQGLTDKVQMLMELDGITRDQAIEKLQMIVDNNKEINKINGVSSALDSMKSMSDSQKAFSDQLMNANSEQ
jgi:hypothetical protein